MLLSVLDSLQLMSLFLMKPFYCCLPAVGGDRCGAEHPMVEQAKVWPNPSCCPVPRWGCECKILTAAPATWQEPAVRDGKDAVVFGHCHGEPLASGPTAAASAPGGIWCSGMGVAGFVQWLCKRQQSWTTGGCFLLLLGNPFSPTWLSEPLLLVSLLFQVTSSCGEKFFSHVLAMSVVFYSF